MNYDTKSRKMISHTAQTTPNANALDLLSSSDWNYDAKNGTPYSMRNYATQVKKIQAI